MSTPSCARCAEKYAGDPAALGTTPVLDAALDAGALAAGWQQDGGAWTCTVCLAKAEPQPAAPAAPPQDEHEAPPDTDPYDQYVSMSAELDAGLRGWWAATNESHSAAHFKSRARTGDVTHNIAGLLGSDAEREYWLAALRREFAALEAERSAAA